MKLIAFCGRKGSGKNTVANALVANEMNNMGYSARINNEGKLLVGADVDGVVEERILDMQSHNPAVQQYLYENIFPTVRIYSFADALKEFCINVLGLTYEQCYGTDEQKNSPTHLLWDNMPTVCPKDILAPNELAQPNPIPKRWRDILLFKTGQMTAREVMQYFGTNICRKMYSNVWIDATLRRIANDEPALALICDCRYPNEAIAIQQANGKVIKFTRNPHGNDTHSSETEVDNVNADWLCDNSTMDIKTNCDAVMDKLLEWGIFAKAPEAV